MKYLKNTCLNSFFISSLLFLSCNDAFELTRNDIISDEIVFNDQVLADAFLFDLYDRAQFHISSGNGNLNMGLISSLGGVSKLWCFMASPIYSGNGCRL